MMPLVEFSPSAFPFAPVAKSACPVAFVPVATVGVPSVACSTAVEKTWGCAGLIMCADGAWPLCSTPDSARPTAGTVVPEGSGTVEAFSALASGAIVCAPSMACRRWGSGVCCVCTDARTTPKAALSSVALRSFVPESSGRSAAKRFLCSTDLCLLSAKSSAAFRTSRQGFSKFRVWGDRDNREGLTVSFHLFACSSKAARPEQNPGAAP